MWRNKITCVKGCLISNSKQYDGTQLKLCKLAKKMLNMFRSNAESLKNIALLVYE